MNKLSPVCLFTYNRLNETKLTIEALQQNYLAAESELIIFSDGPKNETNKSEVETVRKYLKTINGFKSIVIIESKENKGLANSIVSGITQVFDKYEKVIVMEDDLISSPNFLNFINLGLNFYQDDENIQSINGYSLSLINKTKDAYFQTRPGSWGWATWKNRWNQETFNKQRIKLEINLNVTVLKQFKQKCGADMPKMLIDSINDQNDSWYARWAFDHFRNNRYSVFPSYSFIQNIGHNTNATHCVGINTYTAEMISDSIIWSNLPIFQIPEKKISSEFLNYFSRRHKIIVRLKLLKTSEGRTQILDEIKRRTGIIKLWKR